ncbi:MAG: DUF4194 domain-containing protein [Kyrpidia tusciae]|nr:DUF4194 domain-containing protein [Kyrpidia tusciae]MBE3551952.1 DUF4194 domain-containing protein [Kyrpidia tusciae]
MDWPNQYLALTDAEKEEFARVISLLFERTFLVREEWDGKQRRLVGNRDYRFVERHLELFHEYLKAGGFELQLDGRLGVMALYNRFGRNRIKVDKYTTYLLYTLRLLYEENMERVSTRREVVVSLQEILAKWFALGLMDRRPPSQHIGQALSRLRRLHVLARVEGSPQDLDSRWMIYPSIVRAVPDERINHLYEQMQKAELWPDSGDSGAGENGGAAKPVHREPPGEEELEDGDGDAWDSEAGEESWDDASEGEGDA